MISIIIPTLNEEKAIAATILSLKDRLTIPHEIIISDGKSKDKTVEIAKKYADKVVEYTGTERQTIAAGRNAGAKVAAGEYLVFMDADCFFKDPQAFFTRALSHFSANPRLTGLAVALRVDPRMASFFDKVVHISLTINFIIINNILHKGATTGEFQMIPRGVFFTLGGFNEKLVAGEDLDMFARLAKEGRTMIDPHMIIYHTGRRAHIIGWATLLTTWVMNILSILFRGKAYSKEWEPVR